MNRNIPPEILEPAVLVVERVFNRKGLTSCA
jgi:hypothetical protein